MKKRKFTAEFKQDAARQIIIEGVAVKEVSERLGVPVGQLYRWKSEHIEELEANNPSSAPSPKKMAAEIAELRKELAKSKRMNEILKKTVGFFSQD
ncbi:MAG: transposase [Opitutaceae bacterium]